ncbi:MAG: hypothetical protein V4603_02660 [Pseudomonadota bacterium]
MAASKILAIILIVLGALGLAYGGFTYTSDRHTSEIGPISIVVDEKERVNVPVWASIGVIVIGGALLLLRGKKLF